MEWPIIVGGAVALLLIFIVLRGLMIVGQNDRVIIERLGRFHKILHPGVNIIIPFFDRPVQTMWLQNSRARPVSRLDMRESILDIPAQEVITKDNVMLVIDAIMYVQIADPKMATYAVSNLPMASGSLAQTSLRSLIGEMELDETLSSREVINQKLKVILDEATDKWGLKVSRVEVKNIDPPHDIQRSMEKQMQAERERRAKVLEAQGDRESRITRSEGQRQEAINHAEGESKSQILRADGEAESIRRVAEAQAQAIRQVIESIGDRDAAVSYLLGLRYLEQFGKFTSKDTDKIFVPYEASAGVSMLGMIRDVMGQGGKSGPRAGFTQD